MVMVPRDRFGYTCDRRGLLPPASEALFDAERSAQLAGREFLGTMRTRFIVEDGRKAWRSAHKSCRRRFELGSTISSNDGLVTALPIITIREPVCGFVQESRRNSRYNPKSLITGSGTCNHFCRSAEHLYHFDSWGIATWLVNTWNRCAADSRAQIPANSGTRWRSVSSGARPKRRSCTIRSSPPKIAQGDADTGS